jgi:hypothetical protein
MTLVYNSVLLYSKKSGGQYSLDFEMTNMDVTRPLIREAYDLWLDIPKNLRNGSSLVVIMGTMSILESRGL